MCVNSGTFTQGRVAETERLLLIAFLKGYDGLVINTLFYCDGSVGCVLVNLV